MTTDAATAPMAQGVRHTGLVVRSLARSLEFYRDLLGLRELSRAVETGPFIEALVGLPEAELEWVKLRAEDGTLVELLQYRSHLRPGDGAGEVCATGRVHLAFTVRDVDALHRALAERGLACKHPPLLSVDGRCKVMYCSDPDNVDLEFVEQVPPPQGPATAGGV